MTDAVTSLSGTPYSVRLQPRPPPKGWVLRAGPPALSGVFLSIFFLRRRRKNMAPGGRKPYCMEIIKTQRLPALKKCHQAAAAQQRVWRLTHTQGRLGCVRRTACGVPGGCRNRGDLPEKWGKNRPTKRTGVCTSLGMGFLDILDDRGVLFGLGADQGAEFGAGLADVVQGIRDGALGVL